METTNVVVFCGGEEFLAYLEFLCFRQQNIWEPVVSPAGKTHEGVTDPLNVAFASKIKTV